MTGDADLLPWGVLLKVQLAADAEPADADTLARLHEALPGEDRRLTGADRDVTVAWWVDAPDAATAAEVAAATLRAIASRLGLGHLTVVRSHAASVAGRRPLLPDIAERASTPSAWSVDIRAAMPVGGSVADPDLLGAVRSALADPGASVTFHGDPEKFLLDDGTGISIRTWVAGPSMEAAVLAAGHKFRRVLDDAGLEDWSLVRVKAWDPRALRDDTFPGADRREATPSGELR